jgi:hypothetical protein
MEECQIKSDKRRPKKAIKETIKKDVAINELDLNMIYNRTFYDVI